MSYLTARPLALLCAVFLAASGIFSETGLPLKLISAATALSALLICLLPPLRRARATRSVILALAAVSAAAILSAAAFDLPEKRAAELAESEHTISGYITDRVTYADYLSVYEARLTEIDGKKANIKIQLTTAYPLDLSPGDSFDAVVQFGLFAENSGGYPEARIMRARGIFSTAEVIEFDRREAKASGIMLLLSKLRASLSAAVSSFVGGDEGGLVSALLLGERGGLSPSLKRDFRALGLSHIIALSGLHLAILLGGAEKLLRTLTCPRRVRVLLLCAGAALFTLLVGAPLSVVRASLMFIIYQLSFLFGERRDQLSALLFAAALICILSPSSAADCALRLSFAATLGMIVAGKLIMPAILNKINGKSKPKRAARTVISSLIYSACATVFTLPFSWLYFGSVSVASPISTLIATPFVTVILTAAPIMLLLAPLPALAAFPAAVCKLCAHVMIALSAASASPGMIVSLAYPFAGIIIALILISAAVIFALDIRRAAAYIAPVAAGVSAFALCLGLYNYSTRNITDVSFITHKTNEAIFLSHRGETVFCDLSDGSRSVINDAGELLSGRVYDDSIDAYMLTHYHRRHLSTFYNLTQSEFISRLILPEPVSDDELALCAELLELAAENGVEPAFYRRGGAAFDCAGIGLETIERTMLSRSTHPLLALKISGGSESVLYIGGAASDAAETLGFADTVVLGAHGPKIKEPFAFGEGESACVFLSENVYLMWSGSRADAIDPTFRLRLESRE